LQSPPATHGGYTLTRSGPPADPKILQAYSTGPNVGCAISNHTGFQPSGSGAEHVEVPEATPQSRCPFAKAFTKPTAPPKVAQEDSRADFCINLNPDLGVRLEYTVPLPCTPCAINFTFSMDAKDDEYIALGFKELEAAYQDSSLIPDMTDYWGMKSSLTKGMYTPLTGKILASSGTCVRHLSADECFAGCIRDVPNEVFTDLITERSNGRVSISFSTPPHSFGATATDVSWYNTGVFKNQRFMWAKGKGDDGGDCSTSVAYGYHFENRGLMGLGFGSSPAGTGLNKPC